MGGALLPLDGGWGCSPGQRTGPHAERGGEHHRVPHTLIGDTVTNPRGRALADWVQLDTLAMASAPSSIESDAFIDHIIYPASLTATEAVARTMHGTDHRAVFAVIDPDPRRSTPAFFRESIRLPQRMDRGHFLNVLDTALARISLDGTPCGIEGGIFRALVEALTAAGAGTRRCAPCARSSSGSASS